jgi:epoxyqueuosine reductase
MIATDLKHWFQEAARRHGFDLCGIAPADLDEQNRHSYQRWLDQGFHGEMEYMKRYQRRDLRAVLPSVRSVVSLGMVYHTSQPLSTECDDSTRGWIARYAWGDDYHDVMKKKMEQLLAEVRAAVSEPFDARIYVDTGPILERAVAWAAGLGWIAKNTCLINEQIGSWFFLGEILTSLELTPDFPAPDRCGTCTACLDACPTGAITGPYVLDATRCISYYTIEVKGAIPEPLRPQLGRHVFGCDICQDVCPWNRRAPVTALPQFLPRALPDRQGRGNPSRPSTHAQGRESEPTGDREGAMADKGAVADPSTFNPPLEQLAELSEDQFRDVFRDSPVLRPRYRGFLRNVCIAMGNSGAERFRPVLERLASSADPLIREHARWALEAISNKTSERSHGRVGSESTPAVFALDKDAAET